MKDESDIVAHNNGPSKKGETPTYSLLLLRGDIGTPLVTFCVAGHFPYLQLDAFEIANAARYNIQQNWKLHNVYHPHVKFENIKRLGPRHKFIVDTGANID